MVVYIPNGATFLSMFVVTIVTPNKVTTHKTSRMARLL